jgi:hypothetical protein
MLTWMVVAPLTTQVFIILNKLYLEFLVANMQSIELLSNEKL